jgi:tetratricopeptide (TPR) repeat protein
MVRNRVILAKDSLRNMIRSLLVFTVVASSVLEAQVSPQAPSAVVMQHASNFESERLRANDLFLASRPLEALPLYEDLCRQDPTVAVFAERYGAGLLAKEVTLSDPAERSKVHLQALQEFKRAQALGDNSAYLRSVLSVDAKTFAGAVFTGVSLSVGYSYRGKPEAQTVFREAEAAFGRSDWTEALKLYVQAAAIDPKWYSPALCAGDSYFRLKDTSDAGIWFTKAIAIDPDRETAYRFWGDALFRAGDFLGAREKFVEALVAEPYSQAPLLAVGQWAQRTGHQLVKPAITRPEFTTPDGILKIDPELATSTKDGRSSWIVYQQYRVAHGARTLDQFIVGGGSDANAVVVHPVGYQHTIAEEHEALRAMLSDIDDKLRAGMLIEANLDPSIRNIRSLEQADVLGAWIAINAADAGIRSDYPEYCTHHRQHLIDYVNAYLMR